MTEKFIVKLLIPNAGVQEVELSANNYLAAKRLAQSQYGSYQIISVKYAKRQSSSDNWQSSDTNRSGASVDEVMLLVGLGFAIIIFIIGAFLWGLAKDILGISDTAPSAVEIKKTTTEIHLPKYSNVEDYCNKLHKNLSRGKDCIKGEQSVYNDLKLTVKNYDESVLDGCINSVGKSNNPSYTKLSLCLTLRQHASDREKNNKQQ